MSNLLTFLGIAILALGVFAIVDGLNERRKRKREAAIPKPAVVHDPPSPPPPPNKYIFGDTCFAELSSISEGDREPWEIYRVDLDSGKCHGGFSTDSEEHAQQLVDFIDSCRKRSSK